MSRVSGSAMAGLQYLMHAIERGIAPIVLHQMRVRALLDQPPTVQHKNALARRRVARRWATMNTVRPRQISVRLS